MEINQRQSKTPDTFSTSLLVFLLMLNVAAALATFSMSSLATGAGKLVILSNFREFDTHGLTNHKAIQEYDNGRFAGEWTEIPDYLGEQAFKYVKIVVAVVSMTFAINAFLIAYCLWQRKA